MGRLRGKRNRDRERDLTILRRAEQSGMVGTDGLRECCFCGCLLTSYDAHLNGFGDAYCEACGHERGLIYHRLIRSPDVLATLTMADALSYDEGVSGRGGRQRGTVDGFTYGGVSRPPTRLVTKQRAASVRGIEREIEREQRRVDRFGNSLEREIVRGIEREIEREQRFDRRVARTFFFLQRKAIASFKQELRTRKLTNAQVKELRFAYAARTESVKRIAARFGVTPEYLREVASGAFYKRAGGPIYLPRPDKEFIWSSGGLVGPWAVNRLAGAGLVLHPEGDWFRVDLGSPAFDEFRAVEAVDGSELYRGERLAVDEVGSAEVVGLGSSKEVRSGVGEDCATHGSHGGATAITDDAATTTARGRDWRTGKFRSKNCARNAVTRDVRAEQQDQAPFKALGAATPATFSAVAE